MEFDKLEFNFFVNWGKSPFAELVSSASFNDESLNLLLDRLRISGLTQNDIDEFTQLYQKNKNDTFIQYIGLQYGIGVKKNPDKARNLLHSKKVSQQDWAQLFLVCHDPELHNKSFLPKKTIDKLKLLAKEQKNVFAKFLICDERLKYPFKSTDAMLAYADKNGEELSKSSLSLGRHLLLNAYLKIKDLHLDPTRSTEFIQYATEAIYDGESAAVSAIIYYYLCADKFGEAKNYLELLASMGCAKAFAELSWFYRTGKTGTPDIEKAKKFMAQANELWSHQNPQPGDLYKPIDLKALSEHVYDKTVVEKLSKMKAQIFDEISTIVSKSIPVLFQLPIALKDLPSYSLKQVVKKVNNTDSRKRRKIKRFQKR